MDKHNEADLTPIVSNDFRNIATFQAFFGLPLDPRYLIDMELRHVSLSEHSTNEKIFYKLLLCNYCGDFLLTFEQPINSTKLSFSNMEIFNVHGHYNSRFNCSSDEFMDELELGEHYECEDFKVVCMTGHMAIHLSVKRLEFELLGDPSKIRYRQYSKPAKKCHKMAHIHRKTIATYSDIRHR